MSEWKKVKIGEICRIVKGTTGIASAEPGEYPLVVTAVERKTCSTYQFDCEAVCIPLVSSSGHGKKSLNNVHYQSGKFALGTILCAVIPNNPDELDARYLHQYLQFYKDTLLVPLMKGAANVSLSMKDIATVEFPLPPIETQRELADLFVSLQEKEKLLHEEYAKQTEYTKQLRQNILQEAIEGKLTADWREEHPVIKGNPDYDAEALFEKIQKGEVSPSLPSQVAPQIASASSVDSLRFVGLSATPSAGNTPATPPKSSHGLDFANAKSKKTRMQFSPITDEEKTFAIPNGWKWVRLGEVGTLSGGKRLPAGENFSDKKTDYVYIRIKDMKDNSVELDDLKYISKELANKLSRYRIFKDEIYITIAGTIGQVGIIPECLDGMNLTENAAKLKPFVISNKFLMKIMMSSFVNEQFRQATYGMAMPKLALKRIADTIIPLPPLAEQKEIIARVEAKLQTVTALEARITEREQLTKSLFQSILKEAFEEV